MTLRTGLLAAGAALIAVTSAQVSQSGAAYSLKMKWAKGKAYGYSISTTVKMGAQSTPSKGTYSLTVKDVKNGVATVAAKFNMPGVASADEQTMKIDSFGKVIDGTGSVQVATLPAKAVKVGEKWTASRKLPAGIPITMKSTYVFKGLKTVNGKKYAEISETMSGASGTMSISGTGSMLIDSAEGMLYKYTTNATLSMKNEKETTKVPITSVVQRTK